MVIVNSGIAVGKTVRFIYKKEQLTGTVIDIEEYKLSKMLRVKVGIVIFYINLNDVLEVIE